MRRYSLVYLLLALTGLTACRLDAGKPAVWTQIATGLEIRDLEVPSGVGEPIKVVALRTSPRHIHVALGQTLTAQLWREHEKSLAAVNGGFFDTNGHSLGLRVSNGRALGRLRTSDWGVFFITNGHAYIQHTREFAQQHKSMRHIRHAVQCGPRLVVDGKPTKVKEQWARRIGIGIQRDGSVIVALSSSAMSLQDWANLWARSSGLNCRDALNLDGGGSTQLSLKTATRNLEMRGSWPVPDAVIIR